MTALTIRQRTKVNAVLSLMHTQGYDVRAVQARAKDLMAKGRGPSAAYDAAVSRAIAADRTTGDMLARVASLIDASNDATVAQYDTALSSFIATGDDSAINALQPTIMEDFTALEARNAAPPPEAQAAALASANAVRDQYARGDTGVSIARASARWKEAPSRAHQQRSPYEGMTPSQIKEAYRADHAERGWQREPEIVAGPGAMNPAATHAQ